MESRRAPAHRSAVGQNQRRGARGSRLADSGCHVLTVHAGRRASCLTVTWNLFYPARPTARFACCQLWHLIPRFLPGRGLFRDNGGLLPGRPVALRSRKWFGSDLVTPLEISPCRFKAGKIAAAGRAAPGARADAQQESRPAGRVVVLHGPLRQFLPVAAGTTRVSPGSVRPDAGFPAGVAAAAAER